MGFGILRTNITSSMEANQKLIMRSRANPHSAPIWTQQYKNWHTVHTLHHTSSIVTNTYCTNTDFAVWELVSIIRIQSNRASSIFANEHYPNRSLSVCELAYCTYIPTSQHYSGKLVLPPYKLRKIRINWHNVYTKPTELADWGKNECCPNTNSAVYAFAYCMCICTNKPAV